LAAAQRRTVLLIAPPSGYGHPWLFPPYSLLALARMFPGTGFRVRIVDGHVDPAWKEHAVENLDDVVCVGITSTTGVQVAHGLDVTKRIKKVRPDVPMVWGGFHASLYPTTTIASPLVDYCVAGQGESSFLALVKALAEQENGRPAVSHIPGLSWKDRGMTRSNPPGFEDINNFPRFNYEFVKMGDYVREWKGLRAVSFITSVGCPFPCTFCSVPGVLKKKFSGMTPERVLAEVKHLADDFGVNYVKFFDDNYFTDRNRTLGVAEAFIDAGLKVRYMAEPRVDLFSRMKDHEVARLAKSGLDTILVGVESGSPDMLVKVMKRITVEQVLATARQAKRHGMGGIFSFMASLPGETRQTMLESVGLIRQLLTMSDRFTISYKTYVPYYAGPAELERVKQQYPDYYVPQTLEDWANLEPGIFQTEYFDSPLAGEEINAIGWYAYGISRSLSHLSLRPEWNPHYSLPRLAFYKTARKVGSAMLRLPGHRSMATTGRTLRFVNKTLFPYATYA
jgi:radical SAM superfamily enzyme YgiQ (UPF0313 family)